MVALAAAPSRRATIVLMTVEPLRDVRNHFSDVIDRVEHEHERVTVTRNGRPVAVILSPEDLAELEEPLRSSATQRPWPTSAKPMRRMPQVPSFAESMPFASALVSHGRYELVLTPPAIHAVQSGLPERVAAAAIEFLTGALVENPHRVGEQLGGDLAGVHSARRGTYRPVSNKRGAALVVLRIDHRRDAYRPR
jgi:mRNA interferase RelE/StbE